MLRRKSNGFWWNIGIDIGWEDTLHSSFIIAQRCRSVCKFWCTMKMTMNFPHSDLTIIFFYIMRTSKRSTIKIFSPRNFCRLPKTNSQFYNFKKYLKHCHSMEIGSNYKISERKKSTKNFWIWFFLFNLIYN